MDNIKRLKIVLKAFYDKDCRFMVMDYFGLCDSLSDEEYLKRKFHMLMGKSLNLDNPETFNEKLQWLKLHNRKDIYTTMVDKFLVKEYVAGIIGEEYIIPTIGVWNDPDDIDFDKLPDQFVLKCNHNSGNGLCICKDKLQMDTESIKNELRKGLEEDYYIQNREWPYKNVKRKIIAEPYLEDKATKELRDYKFFCFNGIPQILFIASDRQLVGEDTKFDFFDMEGNHLPFINGHPNANNCPKLPESFEEMKTLARKLSANIPHVRVDLYEIDGKIKFGELTFFHWSGFVPFVPEVWDHVFGDMLILPDK